MLRPAQPFGLNTTTRTPILYNKYIQPFLTANNLLIVSPDPSDPDATLANVGYRGKSLGGRADKYETNTQQYVAVSTAPHGAGTTTRGSRMAMPSSRYGGRRLYGLHRVFQRHQRRTLRSDHGTGGASVAPFILDNKFLTSHSKLSNAHLGAQHNFFELPGGPTILALGLDFFKQKYNVDYGDYYLYGSGFSTQPALPSFPIGGNYGQVPLGMDRDNWAAYAEWFVPITKTLEATASIRYDHYDKTHSNWVSRRRQSLSPACSISWRTRTSATRSARRPTRSRRAGCRSRNCWCAALTGTGFRAPP
jgi:iron complex outermembrane receptor protein